MTKVLVLILLLFTTPCLAVEGSQNFYLGDFSNNNIINASVMGGLCLIPSSILAISGRKDLSFVGPIFGLAVDWLFKSAWSHTPAAKQAYEEGYAESLGCVGAELITLTW